MTVTGLIFEIDGRGDVGVEMSAWPTTIGFSKHFIEETTFIRPRPPGHITVRAKNGMAVYRMSHASKADQFLGELVYSEGP